MILNRLRRLTLGLTTRSNIYSTIRDSIITLLTYLKEVLVLDFCTSFSSGSDQIADKSGDNNHTTLYSGRGVSLDGISSYISIPLNLELQAFHDIGVVIKVRGTSGATVHHEFVGADATFYAPAVITATGVWETAEGITSAGFTSTVTELRIGRNDTDYLTADISEITVTNQFTGEVIGQWIASEWSDDSAGGLDTLPLFNSILNNLHAVCVGCAGFTAESGIYQTAASSWNKYTWFDGVETTGTFVNLGSNIEMSGDFVLSWEQYQSDKVNDAAVMGGPFSNFVRWDSGYLIVRIAGTIYNLDGATAPTANSYSSCVLERSGTSLTFTRNGVVLDTLTVNTDSFWVDEIGTRASGAGLGIFKGLLFNININGVAAYAGLGSAPWSDTIGGNDGTESGAFTRMMCAVSDSDGNKDALGSSIQNLRINNHVLNLFDEGEYASIFDEKPLDGIRSLTMAVYNDGTTKDILQSSGGTSFVDIANDTLQTDQSGTHTYYVNGVETTTLLTGWNIIGITFDAGQELGGGKFVATSGSLLCYDPTALTAGDHLSNFASFKSKYRL